MKIEGKTFVITGGASGLGLATTKHLYSLGANLVIIDMNEEAGNNLVKQLGSDRASFHCVDITLGEPLQKALDSAVNKFKEIHGAINCAGVASAMRVIKRNGDIFPLELFERVMSVNVTGTFNVIRLVASIINKQKVQKDNEGKANESEEKGVFVMTASVAAFDGQPGQAAYSASKGGIVSMTLPLAREFTPLKCRIMTIAPGLFATPLVTGLPAPAVKSIEDSIPFPSRLGKPEEFAFLVQHIIESSYLNGEVIRLDGALRLSKL
ncbi:hypothetical protein DICPUDRAFT_58822 [Dictyostelium purpureum]|uniref:Ketoreductase domain-containing protein n=1 Tax=Dictyostelium purpureum TaxID=5786 RepID=F1A335_DICPU|nr:uncharacterized protein DICPUDRAFT_58822 [Dictyostelium purpureum]EGC29391.1 hypothetical protein DICPUDRAFT_58822 [Dictyostelium purpureum]|eukprot:XP_003294078.1 hypothetical protein DICPUDRAFT_58822 [Dictyostelium purpureum]